MTATHTNYMHPDHLRVVDGNRVLCVKPGCETYKRTIRPGLPEWTGEDGTLPPLSSFAHYG